MSKRIIVSVTNDLSADQRVHKVCTSLHEMGFDVLLVGRKLRTSFPLSRVYSTKRMKFIFNNGVFFYAIYNLRLFFFLLFSKCDLLLSNDLDTLLANHLASKIKKISLVYDSHELFPESPELQKKPFIKLVWEILEAYLLPKQKYAYTVCESIANFYKNKYDINMEVIRNVPYLLNKKKPIIKQKTLIYQGTINPGRGLELAIKTLPFLDGVKLLIIGGGKGIVDLQKIAKDQGVESQVEFIGWVPQEKLQAFTVQAGVGLLLEEPLGLSFNYALPNKLFDYIHAEIPFVASPLYEVKRIVEKYKVGDLLIKRDPVILSQQIKQLFEKKYSFSLAKKELNWQIEEKKLKKIFISFLN